MSLNCSRGCDFRLGCWLGLLCMFSFSVFWSCACVRLLGVVWCVRFIFTDVFR